MSDQEAPKERDEQHEYATALGFFVMKFAEVERVSQIMLAHLSGLEKMAANAVFSGVRIGQAKSMANRLLDVKGIAEDDPRRIDLKRAFSQLTHITSVRNDLLHYGAGNDAELGSVATNEFALHMPERARKVPISPAILFAMQQDLDQINWVLVSCVGRFNHADFPTGFTEAGIGPWRYTPPPQPPPPKPRLARLDKRKGQPPASQG